MTHIALMCIKKIIKNWNTKVQARYFWKTKFLEFNDTNIIFQVWTLKIKIKFAKNPKLYKKVFFVFVIRNFNYKNICNEFMVHFKHVIIYVNVLELLLHKIIWEVENKTKKSSLLSYRKEIFLFCLHFLTYYRSVKFSQIAALLKPTHSKKAWFFM